MIIKNLPQFKTDKEFFDFIVENENDIFNQAKSEVKYADGFNHFTNPLKEGIANKAQEPTTEDLLAKDVLKVTAVINTTNVLDSHRDVHIKGLWDKSLKEGGRKIMHVQEHKSREFDKIISSGDDLKAYVEDTTFKKLGYNLKGTTEALVFDSNVRKDRNQYMHKQYAKKYVTNHSVGMIYVKMVTCINHEDYPVQKENYDKYAPMIVNQDVLEGIKVFWAILEAKVIEGSAVPNGSNWITPTTSTKSVEEQEEEQISPSTKAMLKFLNIE